MTTLKRSMQDNFWPATSESFGNPSACLYCFSPASLLLHKVHLCLLKAALLKQIDKSFLSIKYWLNQLLALRERFSGRVGNCVGKHGIQSQYNSKSNRKKGRGGLGLSPAFQISPTTAISELLQVIKQRLEISLKLWAKPKQKDSITDSEPSQVDF